MNQNAHSPARLESNAKQNDQNDYHFEKIQKALHQAQKNSGDFRYIRKYQNKKKSEVIDDIIQTISSQ